MPGLHEPAKAMLQKTRSGKARFMNEVTTKEISVKPQKTGMAFLE